LGISLNALGSIISELGLQEGGERRNDVDHEHLDRMFLIQLMLENSEVTILEYLEKFDSTFLI